MRTPIALAAAACVLLVTITAAGQTPQKIEREEIRIGDAENTPIRAKAESIIEIMAKKYVNQARRQLHVEQRRKGASGGDRGSLGRDHDDPASGAADSAGYEEDPGADAVGAEEDSFEIIDLFDAAEEYAEADPEQYMDPEDSAGDLVYLGTWTATAYCACPECCGSFSSGYTASGTWATQGRTVACSSLEFGTRLLIGDHVYIVEDRGVEGNWVDIFFESHEDALAFGMQQVEVYLVTEG